MNGKTDPPYSGMIITDPSEIAFGEAVRHLRPLAQAVPTSLLQARTNHKPARVVRQAAPDVERATRWAAFGHSADLIAPLRLLRFPAPIE